MNLVHNCAKTNYIRVLQSKFLHSSIFIQCTNVNRENYINESRTFECRKFKSTIDLSQNYRRNDK
jgi:hypothetical protein